MSDKKEGAGGVPRYELSQSAYVYPVKDMLEVDSDVTVVGMDRDVAKLEADLERVTRERDEALDVLEFYGNSENYHYGDGGQDESVMEMDDGQKAREFTEANSLQAAHAGLCEVVLQDEKDLERVTEALATAESSRDGWHEQACKDAREGKEAKGEVARLREALEAAQAVEDHNFVERGLTAEERAKEHMRLGAREALDECARLSGIANRLRLKALAQGGERDGA